MRESARTPVAIAAAALTVQLLLGAPGSCRAEVIHSGISLPYLQDRPESAEARRRREAVVRVYAGRVGDSQSKRSGTGFVVSKSGTRCVVVTADHVIAGANYVTIGSGFDPAEVLMRDKANDLAALLVTGLNSEPLVVDLESPLAPPLHSGGFGGDGVYLETSGPTITAGVFIGNPTRPAFSGVARHGDSGGPVFNREGRVVGVVMQAFAGEVYYSGGGPLKRLIESARKQSENPNRVQAPRLVDSQPTVGGTVLEFQVDSFRVSPTR